MQQFNNIQIIYQDNDLLVINKPSGIVVNRAESVKEETIQDFMDSSFPLSFINPNEREFNSRSGVVHRLDKETSGLMVLAKNNEAFQKLKLQFKNRQTKKRYVALVHGKLEPKKGTVNLPLKRNPLNRMRFTVKTDGKMARTEYEVEALKKTEKGQDFSLLSINLKTGRTHQIRVHFSFLGFPLVSDPIYLGKRLKDDLLWCPRIFLHAKYLAFFHPHDNRLMKFNSELPEDLTKALNYLR